MSVYEEIDDAPAQSGVDPFRLGPRMLIGLLFCLLLVGGVGGWAVTVPLSGAVISQGVVVVDDSLQNIQHRDGGIVSEIAIHEGDAVLAGQLLFRIDDAQTQAELSIVRAQMVELTARRARLLAERDGLSEISFPQGYGPDHPEAVLIAEGEQRLFIGQRTTRESQKQQLVLGIDQITKEVEGMQGQYAAKLAEMDLVEAEYQRTKEMTDRQLTEAGRLYAIDRERTRMDGELSEMVASIARARTKVSEIRLQILAVDDTARTDAQRELAQVETRLSELSERAIALDDRLARTEIRAPRDGIVNELNIHTIGGVVAPGETLMTLVPKGSALSVEIRLSPVSVEQVSVGQDTRLRFSSFNKRTTPELNGIISFVSPATSRDPATGEQYYQATVEIPAPEIERLGTSRLLPGMPVEVLVTTGDRTFASYLLKPIVDQFSNAFRER